MKILRYLLCSLLLLNILPANTLAQVNVLPAPGLEFLDLGYNSTTQQTTIVGHNLNGVRTPAIFRANANGTFTQNVLSNLPGASENATTVNISSDGTRVAGFSPSTNSINVEGATWLSSSPTSAVGIGFVPNLPTGSAALAAWAGGVAGHSGNAQRAISWTPANGIQELPGTGSTISLATDASADGSVFVGISAVDLAGGAAYFWDSNGINRLDDNIPGFTLVDSAANAISPDGNLIAGDITVVSANNGVQTFATIWRGPNRVLEVLRDANGNLIQGSVNDIANSGYAVGVLVQAGNNFSNGFIWHAEFTNGITIFENWLNGRQANFSPQIVSTTVTGISDDVDSGTLRFTVDDANQPYLVEVSAAELQGGAPGGIPPVVGSVQGDGATRFALWNSFLNMWNILEIINDTNVAQQVSINTFDINGALINTNQFQIEPGVQQDLLVHEFEGIVPNSYGIITIDGNVTGRMVFYRPLNPQGADFDFAFALPITSDLSTGTTGVGYNTFEPSNVPVQNWLSIINTENDTRTFVVNQFDQQGQLITTSTQTLAPRSRLDVESGHVNPGPFVVGYTEVVPQDPSTRYLALLIRYGQRSFDSYDFAFPLLTKSPSSQKIVAPLNTFVNADNWIEVINPNDFPISVDINLYNAQGQRSDINSISLQPKAQQHFFANSLIGFEQVGHVDILSNSPIITNSMVYERVSQGGELLTMYGLQAGPNTPNALPNSFNTFLGFQNILRVNNLTDAAAVSYTHLTLPTKA